MKEMNYLLVLIESLEAGLHGGGGGKYGGG